jgi:ribosomal protein S1
MEIEWMKPGDKERGVIHLQNEEEKEEKLRHWEAEFEAGTVIKLSIMQLREDQCVYLLYLL